MVADLADRPLELLFAQQDDQALKASLLHRLANNIPAGVSEERVQVLLHEGMQRMQERMQEGLLSVMKTVLSRLAQRSGRVCLPTISESGESFDDLAKMIGTRVIEA